MQRAVQVDCQHVAAQIATGQGKGEGASKSIIFVLTEADQKVAAESIMQIMMPLAGPADVRAGNRGMQTERQTETEGKTERQTEHRHRMQSVLS